MIEQRPLGNTMPITGFCGWFGGPALGTPEQALAAMGSTLAAHRYTVVHGPLGLAASAPSLDGRIRRHGELVLVILGTTRWHDAELQRIAAEAGDALALQSAYHKHGLGLLQRLFGGFSLALIDFAKNEALFAVDRMGIGALNYATPHAGGIVFGTRADAVAAHPNIHGDIDEQAIFDYLFFHMVPAPRVVFKEQHKLLPGHYVHVQNGRVNVGCYWQPQFSEAHTQSPERLAAELKQCLKTAVARSHPDAATGAFLSGGLDSSTVSGMLAAVSDTGAKTYSIGFDAERYDETAYARISARHFKTDHHEYYVTPRDVVETVPKIAAAYDEPFGNSSAVPVFCCARLARADGVTRMLAGDGGDELFGGNERYVTQHVFQRYYQLPHALRKWLVEPLALSLPGANFFTLLQKAQSYIRQARIPMPDRLQSYNYLLREPVENVIHPQLLSAVNTTEPYHLMREAYDIDASMLNRMMFLDWRITLADNDLRKVNRMCELAGVEVLYPMLDDDLVAFSTRVPTDIKIKGNTLRHFYKQALQDFLPPEVITKSKHGFGLPFGVWMSSDQKLKELAYDSIASFKARQYVRSDYLDQLIARHQNEHAAYYGGFIWVLMMLELWLQK